MNAYRLKPLSFPWPPVLYGCSILAAVLLDRVASLPELQIDPTLAWFAGAVVVTLAVFLDVWAFKTLVESQTTVFPHRCATHLVTRGPFRFTRNPIYLGDTLLMAGMALLTGNSWFLVMGLVAAVITTVIAIRREERHLLARFGIEFERYCQRTRRWI